MIDTSANVIISKANEVFLRVNAEPHIEYELRDHFTFQVEGEKFMPQYRNRNWNGEIHLQCYYTGHSMKKHVNNWYEIEFQHINLYNSTINQSKVNPHIVPVRNLEICEAINVSQT